MSDTYGELLRKAMRNQHPPITRTKLQAMMDGQFSYEHVRKIVGGLPLMSEKFNDEVCKALHLDPAAMWQVALREKMARSGADLTAMMMPDPRLKDFWAELSKDDRERLLSIAQGMVETRRAERSFREEDDPEVIREHINYLIERHAQVTGFNSSVAKRMSRKGVLLDERRAAAR